MPDEWGEWAVDFAVPKILTKKLCFLISYELDFDRDHIQGTYREKRREYKMRV